MQKKKICKNIILGKSIRIYNMNDNTNAESVQKGFNELYLSCLIYSVNCSLIFSVYFIARKT